MVTVYYRPVLSGLIKYTFSNMRAANQWLESCGIKDYQVEIFDDKQDYVIAAIYRLFKTGKYSKDQAIDKLTNRAKINNAANTVAQWEKSISKGKGGIAWPV